MLHGIHATRLPQQSSASMYTDIVDANQHERRLALDELRRTWRNESMKIMNREDLTIEDAEMIRDTRYAIQEDRFDARGYHYAVIREHGLSQLKSFEDLIPVTLTDDEFSTRAIDGRCGLRFGQGRFRDDIFAFVRSGDYEFQHRLPCAPLIDRKDAGMLLVFQDFGYEMREGMQENVHGWILQVTFVVEILPQTAERAVRGVCASVTPFRMPMVTALTVDDYHQRLREQQRNRMYRRVAKGLGAALATLVVGKQLFRIARRPARANSRSSSFSAVERFFRRA
jgi:hypothetical protein